MSYTNCLNFSFPYSFTRSQKNMMVVLITEVKDIFSAVFARYTSLRDNINRDRFAICDTIKNIEKTKRSQITETIKTKLDNFFSRVEKDLKISLNLSSRINDCVNFEFETHEFGKEYDLAIAKRNAIDALNLHQLEKDIYAWRDKMYDAIHEIAKEVVISDLGKETLDKFIERIKSIPTPTVPSIPDIIKATSPSKNKTK